VFAPTAPQASFASLLDEVDEMRKDSVWVLIGLIVFILLMIVIF
jgi:hypothetical protein